MTSETTLSAVGIEYEYKWRVDAAAEGWAAEHPESGDHLVRAVLEKAAPVLGGERGEPHTFTQSALYLDTAAWQLSDSGLSLAALVNYGAMTGTGWLVLKETVRYAGDRRDALEVAERIPTSEISRAVADGTAAPLRRLAQRLGPVLGDITPYGKAVQRRRKVLWRLGDGLILGITLDSSRLTALGGHADQGTPHWWFEIEANSGDTRALDALEELAAAVTGVFGAAPDRETKPQATARLSGWTGGSA
ncbi:CYTH domain-containing protein [Streptomyces sp. NPDC005180]|uniref:hypothetical protein n=1 Tax=Streptomyces sp. NPDC005180 TaxID=3156868 RepID=UPI0033A07176